MTELEKSLRDFEAYLKKEKNASSNTLSSYLRDLRQFGAWLVNTKGLSLQQAGEDEISTYFRFLRSSGKSQSTVQRCSATLRCYYAHLIDRHKLKENPARHVTMDRQRRKLPQVLSSGEVELFLEQPDLSDAKGIRDKAILELIYATGMRVSELVMLDVGDVNLKMDFVACGSEQGSGRIIPIGRLCKEALIAYLETDRASMLTDPSEQALFINYTGHRLTRQGLWKIIRHYADKAGIRKRITPQILRHSFAVHMLQNGADLKSLQELLGHEDAAATQVYRTAEKENLKEVYAKAHPRA